MNVYAAVILGAILVEYVVHLVADLLNLRALEPELPAEFRDVADPETYRRSQEYTRARTRFGLVPATFDLAVLLAFWFLGGFAWADEAARGLGLGPIATGLVFIGGLSIARALLSTPFDLWSTFVIEERFGFNRTTPGTFFADRAKGLGLALLLSGPLLAAILWFLREAGPSAWLWCWGIATFFTLALQYAAPTWIMPLFNRFTRLEDEELEREILEYARSVSFPVKDVFVMDGSRRSTKGNAFFAGFGKRKRIALFDTLIARQTRRELVSVLAHEIGHYKRRHVPRSTALGILQLGLLFWLLSFFLNEPRLFAAFGVGEPSVHAGLVFFALLYTPVQMVLALASNAWTRHCEFEADEYARETTGEAESLVSALKKLSVDSLSNLTPHPFYVVLHHSHPPVLRRIAALRASV